MTRELSLYTRIGGYDFLARVVDEFLVRLAGDPVLERFGVGMNLDRQRRNRQLTLDFLVHATGGPALYLGQDMRIAHQGLGVTSVDWVLAAEHFRLVVEEGELPKREASELQAVFANSRDDVVQS